MKFAKTVLTSFLDYPKSISTVLFTVGCNFRCPYCHNPELVLERVEVASEEEILEELSKRKITKHVVITGGEPTIQEDLVEFVRKLKMRNFFVKLDTNGSNPDTIETLLSHGLLDYVALDIKSGIDKFHRVAGLDETVAQRVFHNVLRTLTILRQHRTPYEIRTTYVPGLMDEQDLVQIAEIAKDSPWYLQRFNPKKTLLPFPETSNVYPAELSKLASRFKVEVR